MIISAILILKRIDKTDYLNPEALWKIKSTHLSKVLKSTLTILYKYNRRHWLKGNHVFTYIGSEELKWLQ